jgi:uncharacterized protein (DUF2147 family)
MNLTNATRALVLSGLALASVAATAQSSATQQSWANRYFLTAGRANRPNTMALDAEGNVYVATTCSDGTYGDVVLLKYNAGGTLLWASRYNGPAGKDDGATGLVLDAQGNAYVSGYTEVNGRYSDMLVLKFDAAGNRLWDSIYGPEGETYDAARAISLDPHGNVYVSGPSDDGSWNFTKDYVTLKINSEGVRQWVRRHVATNAAHNLYRQVVDSAGNVYLASDTRPNAPTGQDILLIKYDTAGFLKWTRTWNAGGASHDVPLTLAFESTGNLVVVGRTGPSQWTSNGGVVLKYTPAGELFSTNTSTGSDAGSSPSSGVLDAQDNLYVVGQIPNASNQYRAYVTKYDSSGAIAWSQIYDDPDSPSDQMRLIRLDQFGGIYIAGDVASGDGSPGTRDMAVVKLRPSGHLVWNRRYNSPNNHGDYAIDLRVDSEGNLHLTGECDRPGGNLNGTDVFTVKYMQSAIATDDQYTGPNDSLMNVGVQQGLLANDQFTFGGDVVLVQGTSKGDVSLATDGSFTYRPDPGASGLDWFSYRIVKDGMSSNVATVSINLVSTVRLSALSLNPTTVIGGQSSTGTVTLVAPAPNGGAEVALVSGSSAIRVPSSVSVPGGATSTTFTVTTSPVSGTAVRTVTATRGGVSRTVNMTLLAGLTNFTVSATNVVGGTALTGTVTLGGPAGAGGVSVAIREDTSVLESPTSVTVPQGATSANFPIGTGRVGSPVTRPISAQLAGVTKTVNITLNPGAVLTGLSLSKSSVKGGESLTGTVTIDRAAGQGGVTVTLASGSSVITVPGSVTIPQGASTVSFTIGTGRVGATATRYVSASYLGVTRSAALTLTP